MPIQLVEVGAVQSAPVESGTNVSLTYANLWVLELSHKQ